MQHWLRGVLDRVDVQRERGFLLLLAEQVLHVLEIVLQLQSQLVAGAAAFQLAKPIDLAPNGLRVGNPLDERAVFGETRYALGLKRRRRIVRRCRAGGAFLRPASRQRGFG